MYERKQMSYNTREKPIQNCTNEYLDSSAVPFWVIQGYRQTDGQTDKRRAMFKAPLGAGIRM